MTEQKQTEEVIKLPAGVKAYASFKDEETGKETQIGLTPRKIKRGAWEGVIYAGFRDAKTQDDVLQDISAFGLDKICTWLNDKKNQWCIQAFYQSSDAGPEITKDKDDGDYLGTDWDKYVKSLEEGKVSGDTYEELFERKNALGAELEELFENLDPTKSTPEKMVQALSRGKVVKKEIHAINVQIAERKADSLARKAKKNKAKLVGETVS